MTSSYSSPLSKQNKKNYYYKLSSKQYEILITKSVQKEYKKSDERTVWQTTAEDKNIAERLELSGRINATAQREAFVTLTKKNSGTNQHAGLSTPAYLKANRLLKISTTT